MKANKRMFLLFSHTLTEKQIEDAQKNWGVKEFIYLPDPLQKLWSNVPPYLNSIQEHVAPLLTWLKEHVTYTDLVLVQGDYGATYYFVHYCKTNNITCVYSTTERKAVEKIVDGKVEVIRMIEHCIFREY